MSFQIDCGFKGFHSAGSYHLVSELGFQSGLILSFFFLVYLILGHHCSRVTKKKKTWLLKFIVEEFVLVETSCSRVCVG